MRAAIAETTRWLARRVGMAVVAPASARDLGVVRVLFFSAILLLSFSSQNHFERFALLSPSLQTPIPFSRALHLGPLSESLMLAILWSWRAALLAAAAGLFTRSACALSALLGAYILVLPNTWGKVDHDDAMVLVALLIFAVARSGDGYSLDVRRRGTTVRPPAAGRLASAEDASLAFVDERFGWPTRLLGLMATLVLFSAGVAKLRVSGAAGWALSDNLMWLALRHHYTHQPPTNLALFLSHHSWVAPILATGTVTAELLAPAVVFLRGTPRLVGIAVLVGMLLGFWMTLGVVFPNLILLLLISLVPWGSLFLQGDPQARRRS
jgi:hypothetical protein